MANLIGLSANLPDFLSNKIKLATPSQLKKAGVTKTFKYTDGSGNFFTERAFKEIKALRKREVNKARTIRNKPKKLARLENKTFISKVKDFFVGFENPDDFFVSNGFFNQYSLDDNQREYYKILSKIDDFNYLTKHGKYKVIDSLSKPITKKGTGLYSEGGLLSKKMNAGFKKVLEIRCSIELNKENGYKKGSLCSKEDAAFMAKKLGDWHIVDTDFTTIYGSDVI